MKYASVAKNVIDVTKAPYFADNTGKTDCTQALRQAIDDCFRPVVDALEELRQELLRMAEEQGGDVYAGVEAGRVIDGQVYITCPKKPVPVKILYFPAGTYLVSDTVCYTFDNLSTQQNAGYRCELCRNIHILGEDKETTVIRLADNAAGFEKGAKKPVVSFNKVSRENDETTNCAQMNTLVDITVDCGRGNEGAIGVLYASSNCGRIENVNVKAENALYGIDFDYSSELCMENVCVSGFEYGIRTCLTAPLIMNGVDLSGNREAGVSSYNGHIVARNVRSGDIPTFSLKAGGCGRYYFGDESITCVGSTEGNFVYYESADAPLKMPEFPKQENIPFEEWVCVDDFGAVGDGVTDSTIAIQKALNSGKPVVLFGSGTYLVERTLKIPATVKILDLMYADIKPGYSLIVGELSGVFEVSETSESPLFIKQFSPSEEFCGYFRLCRQTAKRTLVLKDIFMAASLYCNTESGKGSEVYIDNCFTHTNHYTQNASISREGYTSVFCKVIPVEAHGQKLYARNLNIERADVEMLNDGGETVVDGYKVEGAGVLVKTVNGGTTQLNLFNAAWWGNGIKENGLFEVADSALSVCGGQIFCHSEDDDYSRAITIGTGEHATFASLREKSVALQGLDALNRSFGRMIVQMQVTKKESAKPIILKIRKLKK